jgi:hypothetical protein
LLLTCHDGELKFSSSDEKVSLQKTKQAKTCSYSVFQGFRQAKFDKGGSILSSGQFLILPQLPQKMKLASKVVKVDSKIIISLPKIPETHCMSSRSLTLVDSQGHLLPSESPTWKSLTWHFGLGFRFMKILDYGTVLRNLFPLKVSSNFNLVTNCNQKLIFNSVEQ